MYMHTPMQGTKTETTDGKANVHGEQSTLLAKHKGTYGLRPMQTYLASSEILRAVFSG
jgi:hypothetical protein